MTHLTKQNCFQFHAVYLELAECEWWGMEFYHSLQPIVVRPGMLYVYVSKVLCKNCNERLAIVLISTHTHAMKVRRVKTILIQF